MGCNETTPTVTPLMAWQAQLTPEQRLEISRKANQARWNPVQRTASKAWCEDNLVRITELAMSKKCEVPAAQLTIARAAIMNLAELNGWIAPSRSENVKVDLSKLTLSQLRNYMADRMNQLDPADRAQLAQLAPGVIDAAVEAVGVETAQVDSSEVQTDQ